MELKDMQNARMPLQYLTQLRNQKPSRIGIVFCNKSVVLWGMSTYAVTRAVVKRRATGGSVSDLLWLNTDEFGEAVLHFNKSHIPSSKVMIAYDSNDGLFYVYSADGEDRMSIGRASAPNASSGLEDEAFSDPKALWDAMEKTLISSNVEFGVNNLKRVLPVSDNVNITGSNSHISKIHAILSGDVDKPVDTYECWISHVNTLLANEVKDEDIINRASEYDTLVALAGDGSRKSLEVLCSVLTQMQRSEIMRKFKEKIG